jgi:hypothetical protein
MDTERLLWGCGLQGRQHPVAGCCEHGDELSGCMHSGEMLDSLPSADFVNSSYLVPVTDKWSDIQRHWLYRCPTKHLPNYGSLFIGLLWVRNVLLARVEISTVTRLSDKCVPIILVSLCPHHPSEHLHVWCWLIDGPTKWVTRSSGTLTSDCLLQASSAGHVISFGSFQAGLTLWSRSSSKCYLRIQSVPQREHYTSPLQRSTG